MSNPSASTPSRGGLSLYANLLDPSNASGASISRAPVVFKQPTTEPIPEDDASAKKPQIDPAALRFQPTKRPQLSNQKPKPKTTFSKPPPQFAGDSRSAVPAPATSKQPAKSTLADWTAAGDDDDVNGFYGGEKRPRGGRKRRKKNREEYTVVQDWDDIYDPSRPNNYEEYKHSDERIREVREWKDRLYRHRMAKKYDSETDSEDEASRPRMNDQFAPPSGYSFAPPPSNSPLQGASHAASVPIDNTGEDAYARRIRLGASQQEIPPPAPADDVPRPPGIELPPHAHAPSEALPGVVVSRAPVRYNLPPPSPDPSLSRVAAANPANADEEEEEEYEPPETVAGEDEPKSLRPGQKGFAERLMTKYGWSKGQGLGADGSGITSALRVQVEKRRKKPDSEGGGFADPKGIGKIIGGKRNVQGNSSENGKFGPMSEVIVLQHMLEGMDLDEEVGDGGLMQEIGDECSEKYGRVERVYIDRRNDTSAKVFVKFTSQLSALRAVNALEGRIFNGNAIIARFHELEKFEKGIYD